MAAMMPKWPTSGSSEPHARAYKNEENWKAFGRDEAHQKLQATPGMTGGAMGKGGKFAELSASHEDLSDLNDENLAEYTSLIVTYLRAAESKRDDAIINDPYAEVLAGEAGAAMLSFFSKWSSPHSSQLSDYIALRTRSIDDALAQRHPSIQQVVILGAGLDTRAYRLETLAPCHVIEIDSAQRMMQRKQRLLADAGAKVLAQQHHVIIADLAQDAWQTELIAIGFNPQQPTFWVMEGLLYYMTQDSNVRLVKTLDALSPANSQLWADMSGMKLVQGDGPAERAGVFQTRVLKYGENDPTQGVIALLKWKMAVATTLDKPMKLYGREWTPMTWSNKDDAEEGGEEEEGPVVPYFFVTATKPQEINEEPLL